MTIENSDDLVVELLSEILRWTKVGVLNLRETLTQELTSDKHRLVYELSDGIRSSRDIASISGVSFVTVAAWWRRWAELGFVDPSPKFQGRVQRLCSLRLLGISIPEVPGTVTGGQGQPAQKRSRRKATQLGEETEEGIPVNTESPNQTE
jgi:DNA-binding transcriptional MocR family regulator